MENNTKSPVDFDMLDELTEDDELFLSELDEKVEDEEVVIDEVPEVVSPEQPRVQKARKPLFGSISIPKEDEVIVSEPINEPIVVEDNDDFLDELLDDTEEETITYDTNESDSDLTLMSEMEDTIHEKASGKLAFEDNKYDIVVSPDGKTLSELVPSMRKGNRSFDKMIDDLANEDKNVEINGEEFADTRYKSHAIKVVEKKEYNDKRKELSNKFLQRNSKFTEQEKIIMENLGVSNDKFAELMRKGNLSKAQQEAILGAGVKGPERHFKGVRYRTTVGDVAILEYLAIFKFANTRVLRWIKDEPQSRTWRKLDRLRENGLVANKTIIGIPDLWGSTQAGIAVAGYDFKPAFQRMPKMTTISSTMGVNYLAACLWFNTVNVLNLDDFPAENRVAPGKNGDTKMVRGEMLVSEYEIRSSLGKIIYPKGPLMQNRGDRAVYEVVSEVVRKEFATWEQTKEGLSPEWIPGNEFMWVLYPRHQLTMSYHVPDLVVRRDRNPDGSPNSIAVELERHQKNRNSYEQIMRAYKLDTKIYKKVIWVTPNAQVAREIKMAAEAVGFENYDVVPIITKEGTFTDGDIWMI